MTKPDVEKIAAAIARDIAELPDRTSPPDEPMLMLVTEREIMEIITPYIDRTDALEEAAGVCEAEAAEWQRTAGFVSADACRSNAAAIRALKDQPHE